ncbi:MAG: branched-chain amino acid transport system II carrier protein, partial [bacterium]|nr:branched-chain amino acid transport system II carrier protein [bacterium]
MKKIKTSYIVSVGLAVFSMLFGAGNLIYPIETGIKSGSQLIWGISGFIVTAVFIPIIGLVGMILFNGDINAFFNRLGTIAGQTVMFICVLIIGPLIVIPRIVTLSHTMIGPFLPFTILQEQNMTGAFLFSLLFLSLTFLATFRENRIVQIL